MGLVHPGLAQPGVYSLSSASNLKGRATLPTSVQSCLKTTRVETLYPGDKGYEERRKPQNRNYNPHPEVIVLPSSLKQVAGIIRCVASEKGNVKITACGGGHSYAAFSYTGQVIVDSSKMKAMTIDDKKQEVSVQWRQTLKNNFGIVTLFTFSMEKAPPAMVNYELAFASESECSKLLLAVQEHGSLPADDPNGIPLELGVEVDVTGRGPSDDQACVITGQYVGTKPAFLSLIDGLLVEMDGLQFLYKSVQRLGFRRDRSHGRPDAS